LQVLGPDGLAEGNVGFCDENLGRRQLRNGLGGCGFVVGAAHQVGGNAAGTKGDDQDDNSGRIHTLTICSYSRTHEQD